LIVKLDPKMDVAKLPYSVRFYGVTEDLFDELVDEDAKAELLDGVMIVHSPASPRHDDVAAFLRMLMRLYVEERQLGKVLGPDSLIHLATCRKFAPDLFFFTKARLPEPLPEHQFEGAPDLVGEVLSPSNRSDDLNDKRPAYHDARVREIWFVDAENQEVIVDRRGKKRYRTTTISAGTITSSVLSGFWLQADWLWAEPLPTILPCLRQILGGPTG
jgi:Uma2 family endonuclease